MDRGRTMTLDELNEQFDTKIALLMTNFTKGNIQFEEYDIEMTRVGEWYDEELAKIEGES
jgi:hypothetical protein